MNKLLLLFTFLGIASGIFSQVSKTLNLVTAGTLSASLASNELSTITNLTLTGTIDARDFKTMRDEMPLLAMLDLSEVTVAAYNGTEGTAKLKTDYPLKEIPDSAFIHFFVEEKRSMKSIILPQSLTSIGPSAFESCTGLKSITIPSSVTSIGFSAFRTCIHMTTVTLPSSVISIGNYAFSECCGLTTVTIPSSVTSIGDYAFSECVNLTTVRIPSSVTSIGVGAFVGCFMLITVDSNNPNYSSLDGVLYNKVRSTIIQYPKPKIGSFTIPSSVTSIGESAFWCCYGLTTITIPSSVTSIGDYAFRHCDGLTTVEIPSSVTSIGDSAFYYCTGLTSITTSRITPIDLSSNINVFRYVDKTTCTLYVPLGSKSAYQAADQWKDFTNIVEKDLTGITPIISDQKLTIYPNPTTGKVKLVFDQIPKRGTTMTVNDFTGKTIIKQFIQNKEEWIDLKGNSPGVYLIRTDMKDFKVQKIILK